MDDLHGQVYEQQRRHREEVLMILKERDEIFEKYSKVEKQLEKLKSAPKPVTINLNESLNNTPMVSQRKQQRINEENEYLTSQVQKLTA